MNNDALRKRGLQLIEHSEHDIPPIPLTLWEDFPLRFTVEYPVKDFPLEVGFWAEGFGVRFMSLSDDYAICTDANHTYTFSFQSRPEAYDLSGLRIQWFTDSLDDAIAAFEARGIPHHIYYQSSIQRYVRIMSPAGVTVEFWSGMEDHCP